MEMPDTAQLARFYEQEYQRGSAEDPARAARYSRWRALGAIGKADHVVELCAVAGLTPTSTLEVGCGDGALLCELCRRGFGGRLAGFEIAPAAVAIARGREEIDSVALYDGRALPAGDAEYDLGILSHVLEHVPDPAALLAEVARVCGAVVVEVPLERNISALRPGKRGHAREVGHLQRLSRAGMRRIVTQAGLRIAGELEDPLPLEVHRFLAASARGRASGRPAPPAWLPTPTAATIGAVKWGLRSGLHRAAPGAARRLFTVHYACVCLPGG